MNVSGFARRGALPRLDRDRRGCPAWRREGEESTRARRKRQTADAVCAGGLKTLGSGTASRSAGMTFRSAGRCSGPRAGGAGTGITRISDAIEPGRLVCLSAPVRRREGAAWLCGRNRPRVGGDQCKHGCILIDEACWIKTHGARDEFAMGETWPEIWFSGRVLKEYIF